ncbi:hypothetical protein HAX54_038896, partial [Datura stramonium]|nr:hypothetical protein [Datura stramonium]
MKVRQRLWRERKERRVVLDLVVRQTGGFDGALVVFARKWGWFGGEMNWWRAEMWRFSALVKGERGRRFWGVGVRRSLLEMETREGGKERVRL